MGSALAIFSKTPRRGQVKTRIAEVLGADRALAGHKELLTAVVATAKASDFDRVELWVAGSLSHPMLRRAQDERMALRTQGPGDLGQRMLRAQKRLAKSVSKSIIVGSDCAFVTKHHLHAALDLLDQSDLVLGPAVDGGYYLIGVRRPIPAIFRGIDWGTGRVLEQTLVRARSAAVDVALLPVLSDVDTATDYRRWHAESSAGR